VFKTRKPLPNTITPEEIEGARILRDASSYLWETLDELHRKDLEAYIDYHLMVGRRQAIYKIQYHLQDHFSKVPKGVIV